MFENKGRDGQMQVKKEQRSTELYKMTTLYFRGWILPFQQRNEKVKNKKNQLTFTGAIYKLLP